MLRLLGQLSIYGTKGSIERFASIATMPGGTITQVGTMRKVPDLDSWCYGSPWYRFHLDAIDQEVRDFIIAHAKVEDAIAVPDAGIAYAFFTLCPVDQTYEEAFACVLSRETLKAISHLGVALQIAPASIMPDAPFWVASQST